MTPVARSTPTVSFGTPLPTRSNPQLDRFGQIALVVFLAAQLADGLFTYLGVKTFGLGVEANPIIVGLMTHLGHVPGLLSAKMLAVVLGVSLYQRQIHGAVAALAGFYVAVAIAPWTMLLFF